MPQKTRARLIEDYELHIDVLDDQVHDLIQDNERLKKEVEEATRLRHNIPKIKQREVNKSEYENLERSYKYVNARIEALYAINTYPRHRTKHYEAYIYLLNKLKEDIDRYLAECTLYLRAEDLLTRYDIDNLIPATYTKQILKLFNEEYHSDKNAKPSDKERLKKLDLSKLKRYEKLKDKGTDHLTSEFVKPYLPPTTIQLLTEETTD